MDHDLRLWNKPATFTEVIRQILTLGGPGVTATRLYHKHGTAADRGRQLVSEMQSIAKICKVDMASPDLSVIDATHFEDDIEDLRTQAGAHVEQFASDLAAQWRADRIGEIEFDGRRACRFTYYDYVTSRGLLTDTTVVTRHQHDLVDAKFHKLPANHIEKPERALQIMNRLNLLWPYARIVTGLEVVTSSEAADTIKEPTALAQTLDGAKTLAQRYWKHAAVAAAGAAALAGTVAAASAMAAAAAAATAVAVADPALIIGDKVLVGWE